MTGSTAQDLPNLFSNLVRFQTELWNAVDGRLKSEHDLPLSWFEPMQVMSRTPDCRVFDIASQLSLTVGGTSKLVDRIEAAGHCRRRANPSDRRSSIVELTPEGRALLDKANETFERELTVHLGKLPESSIAQLAATLTNLRSTIRASEFELADSA